MHQGKQVRLGVDIGGTFTDVAMEIGEKLFSTKVLTTYAAPEQAILDAVEKVVAGAGIALEAIDLIIHGTTLATNALIERRGARTALLTTKGFRDVIEMRTENRFEQYDLNIVLPAPLIPRDRRYVVGGRIAASGRELLPLDEDAVEKFAQTMLAQQFESVAIGFIHSYVNGAHEGRARDIVQAIAPDLSISISSEVSPQMREFERFNTVCSNAFIKPLMASYLNRLVDRLQGIGITCPVYMIHSGGGLMSVETAARFPVRLLESGPAGGAIFAADLAARHRLDKILSFDMGGTTAKICLIENSRPKTARTFEVARTYRFKKGSGMPISIPVIEMVEIGAGGGSIAEVDSLRQIRVGPESAGSEPGPACYQRGGSRPTVTDANLILGRIDPANFAGGAIVLSQADAETALANEVGAQLGMPVATTAIGIGEVVDENMTNAARVHAVENGKELSDFTMVAYGGGAPLHACRLCEKLGISTLLIPPGAGVGSAIGFLRAPFGYEAVRGAYLRLSEFDAQHVNAILADLTKEAVAIARSGSAEGELLIETKAFMRYRGQGWEIPVTLPDGEMDETGGALLKERFDVEYSGLFGRPLDRLDVEVMNWSVRAVMMPKPPSPVAEVPLRSNVRVDNKRDIFDPKKARFVSAAVVEREAIKPGMTVVGPAAIIEQETTTIVTAGFDASMQADGSLLLRKKVAHV
ncbi:hydantoinase/oxoprolinase family protein [Mesorhizobium sp. M7A.F.Ca.US.001.04.1.1]|uniref:hydantoinase/oxoprolinase family protein n=1 Tax=unclassified Mesorhizobium TaxID=325217 RepID=UPI000FCA3EC4|nr:MULTISPECIES: hydantoinase/oxoprolinase family protein [unclassified Mesorhizobium]RUY27357.1 hydantoinase/oxoprolinase family protein [Mesorhizobium sp. M7A.F.Ca.US.001.04.2.1]RUY36324.1 hydantoinase/oxoprolinase family protein [Mesorhizobium sp. M7A.F.Ca.US.001.04.1.1]